MKDMNEMKDIGDMKDMGDIGDIDDIADIGGIEATFKNKKTNKNSKLNLIATVIILAIIVGGTYFYIQTKNTPPVIEPLSAIEAVQPSPEIAQTLTPAGVSEELLAGSAAELPEGFTAELAEGFSAELAEKFTADNSTGLTAELSVQTSGVSSDSETVSQRQSLDNSDAMAFASAKKLSTLPLYTTLLIPKNIIRNFVVFIDNLSRGDLFYKYSPLTRPATPFTVVNIDNEIYLNEESYHRYDLYVDIINSIDIDFAIAQYRLLKPLFEFAYQELGYSENGFESTLYDAIETVLNAPIVRDPIKLVAPSAMYKFADAKLEALPSADKLMLRMGPDNILKLRVKLQEMQIALEGLQEWQ